MYKKINKLRQINQHINYQYIILQTYKRIDASVLYDNKQQLRTYAFTEQDNKMSLIKASLIRGYKSQQSETFFHRTCIVSTRNQIVLHAGQAVTEKNEDKLLSPVRTRQIPIGYRKRCHRSIRGNKELFETVGTHNGKQL